MNIAIPLLTTAFFLQGSYLVTYVPIMIILLTIALWRYANIGLFTSLLLSLQCVVTCFVILLFLSMAFGCLITHCGGALRSFGVKRTLHYNVAIVLSVLFYALFEILFLHVHKAILSRRACVIMVIVCNMLTAAIMISTHALLFMR